MKTTRPIRKSNFASEWNLFLKSVHKQRSFLVNSGRSQKRVHRMRSILDRLQPYINYKFTKLGAARFILKYSADIRAIIPEPSQITISRFDLFITQANFLIEHKLQLS